MLNHRALFERNQLLNPAQSERRGILAGGNWIVDRPKIIDAYPVQDSLANILQAGGYMVDGDLKKIMPTKRNPS